jgi:hypothetical protein
MRRLPLLEAIGLAIPAVALWFIFTVESEIAVVTQAEDGAFEMVSRLDRSQPLPPELERVPGEATYRHGGYVYAAWVPGGAGPVLADLAEVVAGEGPYLACAWPEEWEVTGRRAFVMRSPGFLLRSENDVRPLTGTAAPPCPWPRVADPTDDPMDPEQGAPEGWLFSNRAKQRPRLEKLGLRYLTELKRHAERD